MNIFGYVHVNVCGRVLGQSYEKRSMLHGKQLSLSSGCKICKESGEFWVGSDSLCVDKVVQHNNEHREAVLEIRDKACGKRPQQVLLQGEKGG